MASLSSYQRSAMTLIAEIVDDRLTVLCHGASDKTQRLCASAHLGPQICCNV
jgi:hypothetical protein